MIKPQMLEKEFNEWKQNWFNNIPKCKDFVCCHELTSCCVKFLCGCGSIYNTYKSQEIPLECLEITCEDCMAKYDYKKYLGKNDKI